MIIDITAPGRGTDEMALEARVTISAGRGSRDDTFFLFLFYFLFFYFLQSEPGRMS